MFAADAINGGRWRIEGEDLVQCTRATTQPMGPALLFGDAAWTDYDFTFEAMPFEGGNEGFKAFFRVTDRNNLYGVGFGSYHNKYHDVWRVSSGSWKALTGHSPTSILGSVEHGCWHSAEIRVRECRIQCVFDGVPLFDVSDQSGRGGRVGLSTWDTLVRFRNIQVRDPHGQVLWSGLPALGAGTTVTAG